MKKYKIYLLKTAEKDIEEMVDYLSLFYSSTAQKKLDKIFACVSYLESHPYMYPKYNGYIGKQEYRKISVEDYLIFYTVIEKSKMVKIYRIINGKTKLNNK